MPLLRITSNTQRGSLADYYREHATVPGNPEMLELLPHLERVCAEPVVWCLVSMHRLVLLTADDWQSPWLVFIQHDPFGFSVRYRLPDAVAPFPGACIVGEREKPSDAAELIPTALRGCGGWPPHA